tara:strand:- start:290 stop:487 length:198 start_codon:yes stop_codon:yes gene_type:complete
MKITKRQLKKIIKEEKAKLLKESHFDMGPLHIAIDRLIAQMGYEAVALELEGIADQIRMNDPERS